MTEISIIVPVYNVEKYLHKCIDSILNQVFKEFELLLIDDGSTDNSGKICDEYKLKDNRIKVIHKCNGGLSDARNTGLNIARGKYIGFIDSDDWIDKKMYDTLYKLSVKYKADITTCNIKECKCDDRVSNKDTGKIKGFSNSEAIRALYHNQLSGYSACNKLYKRELFNNIEFPNGRIFEDASIMYKLYHISNKVVYVEYDLYNYIKRDNSITTKQVSVKRLDIIPMFNELREFIKNNYNDMSDYIDYMYFNSLRNIIVDIINENSFYEKYNIIKKVSNIVKDNLMQIKNNKSIKLQHKILGIVIGYSPKSLNRLYKFRVERENNGKK